MQESETQKDPPIFVLCVSACCSTSREIPLSLFPPLIRIPIALFPKKDRQREIDPKREREREGERRKSVAVVAAADCLIFCCGEELAQSPISNHNAQDGNSTGNRGSLELHILERELFQAKCSPLTKICSLDNPSSGQQASRGSGSYTNAPNSCLIFALHDRETYKEMNYFPKAGMSLGTLLPRCQKGNFFGNLSPNRSEAKRLPSQKSNKT